MTTKTPILDKVMFAGNRITFRPTAGIYVDNPSSTVLAREIGQILAESQKKDDPTQMFGWCN